MHAKMPKKGSTEKKEVSALRKKYTARKSEIERRLLHFRKVGMSSFCRKTGIPLSHLDLLFWAEETGKIFK